MKHYKHRRRSRNPLGIGSNEIGDVGLGLVGGVGTLALSQVALPSQNTGGTGLLINAGVAIALGYVAGKMKPGYGAPVLTGGLIATGLRAANQYLGTTIPGLSGYVDSPFAVPTISNRYGQVVANPYASLIPAVAVSAPGAGSKGAIAAHSAGMGAAFRTRRMMR